ncbi:MAG: hypothetical protein E6Q97_10830 [Desulfurellales bacterium]|nr:MAG: hypothetical protein E6Q97_10830 [Desulfurellales bacterium]
MKFDVGLLIGELEAAGLPVEGCSSDGRVDWIGQPTAEQVATAERVLQAHEPGKREQARKDRAAWVKGVRARWASLTAAERQEVMLRLFERLFADELAA